MALANVISASGFLAAKSDVSLRQTSSQQCCLSPAESSPDSISCRFVSSFATPRDVKRSSSGPRPPLCSAILRKSSCSKAWVVIAERVARDSVAAAAAVPATALTAPEDPSADEPQPVETEADKNDVPAEAEAEPAFVLVAAAKVIPHPEKVEKGGEDAHYFQTSSWPSVLCVADGVGGWSDNGVDPALYAKELVHHLQIAVEEKPIADPKDLLTAAYKKTKAQGATTAIVGLLNREGKLNVANMGDSGLRVVRGGQVVFATPTLQHYFDCPYQLGHESPDTPADAQLYEVEVQEGDTIVLGSDGLFDNVFDRDIAAVVSVFGGADSAAAEHTAAALAALASKHATDPAYESPYSVDAVQQGVKLPIWKKILGKKITGGKLDDITVVVAQVISPSAPPPVPAAET